MIVIPIIVTLILALLVALFSASHRAKTSFVITSEATALAPGFKHADE